jgi:hypothetical protein
VTFTVGKLAALYNSRAVCLSLQAIATFHQEALSDALAGVAFNLP